MTKSFWQPFERLAGSDKPSDRTNRRLAWGETLACDLLALEKNEGNDYKQDLSIILAGMY